MARTRVTGPVAAAAPRKPAPASARPKRVISTRPGRAARLASSRVTTAVAISWVAATSPAAESDSAKREAKSSTKTGITFAPPLPRVTPAMRATATPKVRAEPLRAFTDRSSARSWGLRPFPGGAPSVRQA
ncbi:hypothetical protein [Streptomyces capitiformicae]|uniref:hypothetical protein n=1 Tax=Streptomyces capitiformicae TaxID=2014920 RepID=UPI001AD84747|nr:hypothetical protein [Streptomyces capitiformicae]